MVMQLKIELLEWYNSQLETKNIFISNTQELASGYYFLELLHVFHPKTVNLTKVYIKPKNQYQTLQNYKNLSACFTKLGWKKFDSQRLSKGKEKDYLSLAQMLRKILSDRLVKQSVARSIMDVTLEQFIGEQDKQEKKQVNEKRAPKVLKMQKIKKQLLRKIGQIQAQLFKRQQKQQGQSAIQQLRSKINTILDSHDVPN